MLEPSPPLRVPITPPEGSYHRTLLSRNEAFDVAASTRQRCKVVLDGKALEVSCFQVWKGLDGVGFKEMFTVKSTCKEVDLCFFSGGGKLFK